LVKVETLKSFLLANEDKLPIFLQSQEEWMLENLWHYAPRPAELAFVATGDIRVRFAQAIRVSPNTPTLDSSYKSYGLVHLKT
jgi:hypothetical protein